MMSLINKSADWPSNYHKAAITASQIWWHPTSMNKLTLNDSATTHDFILMGPDNIKIQTVNKTHWYHLQLEFCCSSSVSSISVSILIIIAARKRSLGQGNVSTPVCHSVYRGRGWLLSMHHKSQADTPRKTPLRKTPSPPQDYHWSGRYASY